MNKLTIFDFDDTLVKTNSNVILRDSQGAIIDELNSEQFAIHQLPAGYSYDFSEFNKVMSPKNKKMLNIFKRLVTRRNGQGMVILTARHENAKRAIRTYLRELCGSSFRAVKVVCLGQSDPFDKALWIRDRVLNDPEINSVYFCDDSWKNVRAVGDVLDNIPQIEKLKLQKV